MTTEPKQLGVFGLWLWIRALQLVLWAWWLTATKFWNLVDALVLLALIYITFLADPFAYGFATERGITFRRYISKHFVSWDKVATVRWRPRTTALEILLNAGLSWRRTLYFPLNPLLKDVVPEFLGRSTPEILLWLEQRVVRAHRESR